MKRVWIVALLFSIACGVNFKPPTTTPTPPPVTPPPIVVTPPAPVDDPTFPGQCRDIWDQELHRPIDPAGLAGCLEQFRRGDTGEQVRAVVRASDEYKQLHAPVPAAPAASDAQLHHVLANFCNLTDSKGRVMFAPFYTSLPDDERADWLKRYREAGSTHVVLSPVSGYPGSPIAPRDLYGDPTAFVAFVREVMRAPSASGAGFVPILILDNGEPGIRGRIDTFWPGIRAALGADVDRVLVVPGWELVNASAASSADLSYALGKLHDLGFPHIWNHLGQGRAAGSSNPGEPDDPWRRWSWPTRAADGSIARDQAGKEIWNTGDAIGEAAEADKIAHPDPAGKWGGAEAPFWKIANGQYAEGLLYQSQSVRPNDDECNPADDGCFLNRWEDVVPRLGNGMNGWRVVHLAYFEGPAYYYYRGQSDSAFAVRIANRVLAMCQKYAVECGFGNGIPSTTVAPFPAEAGRLHVDGKVFRTESGAVWSWRGASSFMLYARYLRGENITPQLDQARALGVNVLRVFGRVLGSGWPDFTDFANPENDPQAAAKLGAFFDLIAAHGLRVEFVPLTYQARTDADARAQLQQAYDVAAGRWNVFIEGANEPDVNDIAVVTIYEGVDRRGVLSAYGVYDQDCDAVHICTLAMLDYLTVHTDRGPEWPRKIKDLLEIRDGFGDASDPRNWFAGSGRPTIGDEPIGADETEQPGRRSASSSDFAQAFGVCASYSAGCTFHSEAGLRSNLLGPHQLDAAKAILDVWSFIPPDAQTGQYTRGGLGTLPVAWPNDAVSLRTYGVILGADAWVTNVRPASGYGLAPAAGWRIVGTISNGTIAHLHREQ